MVSDRVKESEKTEFLDQSQNDRYFISLFRTACLFCCYQPCVLSANGVDFGLLFFCFINFPNHSPSPQRSNYSPKASRSARFLKEVPLVRGEGGWTVIIIYYDFVIMIIILDIIIIIIFFFFFFFFFFIFFFFFWGGG